MAQTRLAQPDVIQRRLIIGHYRTDVVEDEAGKEFAKVASDDRKFPLKNAKEKEFAHDGYARRYKDESEFKDHANGRPVHVGLARKLGCWYRLPQLPTGNDTKFFVLGENHGAFGYRELLAESNQTGNVLGEGGYNDILSATATSDLAENDSPFNEGTDSPLTEYGMENIAAKAAFSLAVFLPKLQADSKTRTPKVKKTEPEADWLAHYQAADPRKRGTGSGLNRVPYYKDGSDEKVYASYGTAAESYDTTTTATRIAKAFADKAAIYAGDHEDKVRSAGAAVAAFLPDLKAIIADPGAAEGRLKTDTRAKVLAALKQLNEIAFLESIKMSGEKAVADKATLTTKYPVTYQTTTKRREAVGDNTDIKAKKWDKEKKKFMAHRDVAMYYSVLKAKAQGDFIMAGMGDHHATDLKAALEADPHNIPVITFEDFVGSKSTSAL